MSSTRAREGREAAEVDDLEDLSDEELDALLAEELAEVCEQQRRAVEELSRDRRRADRAEADARLERELAALRADGAFG